MPKNVVVCSCPVNDKDDHRIIDEVIKKCQTQHLKRAFGEAGDWVDQVTGGGSEWKIAWQTKVIVVVEQLVEDHFKNDGHKFARNEVFLHCIEGGRHCMTERGYMPELIEILNNQKYKGKAYRDHGIKFTQVNLTIDQWRKHCCNSTKTGDSAGGEHEWFKYSKGGNNYSRKCIKCNYDQTWWFGAGWCGGAD